MNFKLCLIRDSFAYFTTQDPKKQWGDDWDDIPYEHNAGEPYGEFKKVAWEGPLYTPADLANCNSKYSVEMINKGAIAWLTCLSEKIITIGAGVSIEEFSTLVRRAGGTVYYERTD